MRMKRDDSKHSEKTTGIPGRKGEHDRASKDRDKRISLLKRADIVPGKEKRGTKNEI